MRCTRRTWAVVVLATFTAGYAVVLNRPLAGTALIGAWALARQRANLVLLGRASGELTVSQVPDRTSANRRDGPRPPVGDDGRRQPRER